MDNNTRFVITGIAIALLIGVVAVFFASGDPDGLESSALVIQGQKTLTGGTPENAEVNEEHLAGESAYDAPAPDYSLGEAFGPWGGMVAIAGGTLLALLAVLGVLWAVKAASHRKEEQAGP